MAASFQWPVTLPQVVQQSFSESVNIGVLRTPVDAGAPKIRRKYKLPTMMNVSFLMTTDQVDELENFVKNLIRGEARFEFPHPRTGQIAEVRIVANNEEYYNISYVSQDYWNVSLVLEIMP